MHTGSTVARSALTRHRIAPAAAAAAVSVVAVVAAEVVMAVAVADSEAVVTEVVSICALQHLHQIANLL